MCLSALVWTLDEIVCGVHVEWNQDLTFYSRCVISDLMACQRNGCVETYAGDGNCPILPL